MSCFDAPDEQLYLLELKINTLELTPDKLYECDDRPLNVRTKFLDLPLLIMSPSDVKAQNGRIPFACGSSCLFSRRPKELIREMQRSPLRVGVFCADETYPVAEMTLQLSGCMCDQVAMATNDADHLPKPFTLHNSYSLHDPGENPSGSVDLEFKITCLGRYVTTHYQMRDNSFVFRSDRDDGRYSVRRVLPEDEAQPQAEEQTSAAVEPKSGEKTPKADNKKKKKKKK